MDWSRCFIINFSFLFILKEICIYAEPINSLLYFQMVFGNDIETVPRIWSWSYFDVDATFHSGQREAFVSAAPSGKKERNGRTEETPPSTLLIPTSSMPHSSKALVTYPSICLSTHFQQHHHPLPSWIMSPALFNIYFEELLVRIRGAAMVGQGVLERMGSSPGHGPRLERASTRGNGSQMPKPKILR